METMVVNGVEVTVHDEGALQQLAAYWIRILIEGAKDQEGDTSQETPSQDRQGHAFETKNC